MISGSSTASVPGWSAASSRSATEPGHAARPGTGAYAATSTPHRSASANPWFCPVMWASSAARSHPAHGVGRSRSVGRTAAAFDRLTRRADALELPVLAAHGLSMWEYVVLSGLVDGPPQTQARLAEAVGRDKTRIIPILDALEARGLLVLSLIHI